MSRRVAGHSRLPWLELRRELTVVPLLCVIDSREIIETVHARRHRARLRSRPYR